MRSLERVKTTGRGRDWARRMQRGREKDQEEKVREAKKEWWIRVEEGFVPSADAQKRDVFVFGRLLNELRDLPHDDDLYGLASSDLPHSP